MLYSGINDGSVPNTTGPWAPAIHTVVNRASQRTVIDFKDSKPRPSLQRTALFSFTAGRFCTDRSSTQSQDHTCRQDRTKVRRNPRLRRILPAVQPYVRTINATPPFQCPPVSTAKPPDLAQSQRTPETPHPHPRLFTVLSQLHWDIRLPIETKASVRELRRVGQLIGVRPRRHGELDVLAVQVLDDGLVRRPAIVMQAVSEAPCTQT